MSQDVLRRWAPLALVVGLLGVACRWVFTPIGDPDTWWHLRLGAELWRHWQLTNPPSWTRFPTQAWVPTQWLPEMVADRIYGVAGLPGLVWLLSAAVVILVVTMYLVCRRQGDPLAAAVATILGFLGMVVTLTPRPQVVSFILLVAVTGVWLQTAQDLRPRWWLVGVSWLWACSHGMWFSGAVVGALVGLGLILDGRVRGAQAGRLLAVPALSVLAAGLTPAGPRLLLSPFAVGGVTQYITEWQAPSIRDLSPAATAVAIAVVAVVGVKGRQRLAWTHVALLLAAAGWTTLSARTVTLGAAMAAPLLAGALQGLLPSRDRGVSRAERGVLLGAAASCIALVAALVPASPALRVPADVPIGLDAALDRLPPHTVILNDFALGGWLEWRHPSLEPVIDGRAEAYSRGQLASYINAVTVQPGWPDYVRRTGAHYALVAQRSPLAAGLPGQLQWRAVGSDHGFVLLTDAAGGWA